MARTDRTQEMVDDTTNFGRKNRDIFPSVRNWCALLDLSDQSVGMVHEFYGLPTHFRLSCRHASLAIAGMDLTQLAQGFIKDHCRNCPHHKPLSAENFGTRLLDELKKEEQTANEHKDFQRKTQQALQQKIAELVSQTKKNAAPPAVSILRLIEGLPSQTEERQIAEKIYEASVLQPSFFMPEALDAMAVHYSNREWGDLLIRATAQVLTNGGKLSPFALERCLAVLTTGVHQEELAKVATQLTDYANLDQWIVWIEHFINSLSYLRVIGYGDQTATPKAEREAYIARCVRGDEEKMKVLFGRVCPL